MDATGKFPDEELIKSLQNGRDRNEAIRFIYNNHFPVLSSFVLNNTGSLEDAEDIFQEVVVSFISLVQLNKFRGESTVKTFLYSMNRFAWLNELKRKGRADERNLNYEKIKDNKAPDAGQYLIEKETQAELNRLMEDLGDTCKKILLLFYYENLSMKDILAQTGYENEQVVRNKKYKCLKQLEKMITEKPALKETFKNLLNG